MSLIFTLKIISDLCFYFAFANFFAIFGGGQPVIQTLPVLAACVFISAALARKKYLRLLPLAILPACFFIVPFGLANFLLFLPAFVFIAVSIYNINKMPPSFGYSGVFFLFLKIYFPFFLLVIALQMRHQLEVSSLPFAIVFLASSVILMRILRLGPEISSRPGFRTMNFLNVFAVLLLGLFLGSRAFTNFIGFLIGTFYFNIFAPILIILVTGFIYILWPLLALFRRLFGRRINVDNETYADEFAFAPQEELFFQEASGNFEALKFILSLVFFILLAYLIFRLFRRLLSYSVKTQGQTVTPGQRFFLSGDKKISSRWFYPENPIRETYRKFLGLCRKAGIERQAHFTSADYETRTREIIASPYEAAQFRSMYINARYGEKSVSSGDKRKMRELFTVIKSAFKRYGRG